MKQEKQLVSAVINLAISDAEAAISKINSNSKTLQASGNRAIEELSRYFKGKSFDMHADLIGLDPQAAREQILDGYFK